MLPGISRFAGYTLPISFEQYKDDILNLEVHDSDVWLCSFPKCGTTWSQEMVWLLGNNLNFAEAKTNYLEARFPFLEISMMPGTEEYTKKHFPNASNSVDAVRKLKGRRFIKSHLPWDLLPKQIQTKEKKPKIIYVTRNPKDVVVSSYHHFQNMSPVKQAFKDFFLDSITNKVVYCPFWDHIFSYADRTHLRNVKILRYEDMKKNFEYEIRKMATFLECDDIEKQDMEKLLDHLSFKSMKANEMVNYDTLFKPLKAAEICDKDFTFMRKGQVGGYKDYFTPEMNAQMDEWTRAAIKKRRADPATLPVVCL